MKVKTLISKILWLGVVGSDKAKQGIRIEKKLDDGRIETISEERTLVTTSFPEGYGIDENFLDNLYNFPEDRKYDGIDIPNAEVKAFIYNTIFDTYDIYI